MTSAANPEVVLLFRLRDEMSAQLAQVNQRLEDTQRTGDRTNQIFTRNTATLAGYSRTLLLFGATALTVASSVARLGAQFGFLNEEQEKNVTTIISTVGALSALAGGLARMIPLILAVARAERTRAIISAMGSVAGIPIVGVALAIAAGAAVGAVIAGVMSHQMGPGQQHQIPGSGAQGRLALVHGGEVISRPSAEGQGGSTVITLSGIFTGNETEFRALGRKLGRYLQEERRIGGLSV